MSTTPNVAQDWVPDLSSFASRMALVRHSMGWNLKEASVKAGLTVNAWARYEDGMRPRDLVDVVSKISRSTGVSRTWLMWGERPEQDSNLQPTGNARISDHFAHLLAA